MLDAVAMADIPLVACIGAARLNQLSTVGERIAHLEAELLEGTILRAVPHTDPRKVRRHASSMCRAADTENPLARSPPDGADDAATHLLREGGAAALAQTRMRLRVA